MFKTNSNSDHTLKMTAQVAQINAFVGRKNPWDGEKRWMRQPFPTIRRDRCKNNCCLQQCCCGKNFNIRPPRSGSEGMLWEVIPKVTPNVFRERFLISSHCVNDQLSHSFMLILSATNLEANCAVKAIAIADNMIYLLRVHNLLACMTAWNPLWQMKGARQVEP